MCVWPYKILINFYYTILHQIILSLDVFRWAFFYFIEYFWTNHIIEEHNLCGLIRLYLASRLNSWGKSHFSVKRWVQFFCPWFWSSLWSLPGAANNRNRHLLWWSKAVPVATPCHRLVHLLKVHTHCVPRCHLFLGDVFFLFLQLFLITSFGHCIPKKSWQRQRCEKERDRALVRAILDTTLTERELIYIELHIFSCAVTKKSRDSKARQTWFKSSHCLLIASCTTWGKSLKRISVSTSSG